MRKIAQNILIALVTLCVANFASIADDSSEEEKGYDAKKGISSGISASVLAKIQEKCKHHLTNAKSNMQRKAKIAFKDCVRREASMSPELFTVLDEKNFSEEEVVLNETDSLKETEVNFFTGMFDFSDNKQSSGLLGLQHQNEELFRDSFLGKLSPITGGFFTEKSSFYLYSGIQAEYELGFLTHHSQFCTGLLQLW